MPLCVRVIGGGVGCLGEIRVGGLGQRWLRLGMVGLGLGIQIGFGSCVLMGRVGLMFG